MNNIIFILSYLSIMTLTYCYRFAAASVVMDSGDVNSTTPIAVANWLLFFSYMLMAFIAYRKGKPNDKGYLGCFPIIAAVFDLVLVFIPFVPTILNLITLIMGLSEKPKDAQAA